MPKILRTIQKELRGATEVQLRLPTGIGVFLLPWFSFQRRPYSFWVKYAGNWVQEKPPLGYGFQRWWLKKNFARTKVTINGKWPNQPTHCLSFENPCLWRNEVSSAKSIVTEKRFKPPYRLLFVGQLRPGKGVDRIMEALKGVNHKLVSQVDFAGDGANMPHYISLSKDLDCKCNFLGFQSRENVHQLMQSAHFLLLPSDSEGFPKVVAEGACYGAIPIVSNISCISHYITADKGFLWETDSSFAQLMLSVLSTSPKELESKSRELNKLSLSFTFEHYYEMLCKRVLS
jgi:glycosyltransferase involved in cell wall biosynthesis